MSNQDENVSLKNECNNYEQTVHALIAFCSLVIHDGTAFIPDSNFGLGRRMNTSESNSIKPENEITPDLVVQKPNGYGLVAEIKKSLNSDKARWKTPVQQLRKYDDELTGWWTEDSKINHSDAVLLIHQTRARAFVRFVESIEEDDAVGQNSSIIQFNLSPEGADFYFFVLEYGKLQDEELHEILDEEGRNIPLKGVIDTFSTLKYYDSEPPLEYLLTDLWGEFFPVIRADFATDDSPLPDNFTVSIKETTNELQKSCGSAIPVLSNDERSVEFPKYSWVKKAFEALEAYKLAKKDPEDNDVYRIDYRAFREDILEKFIAFRIKHKLKENKNSALDETPLPGIFDDQS